METAHPLQQTTANPRLLDLVRGVLRRKHYSIRTEQSYVAWIRRFIFFHGKRHPAQMDKPEVIAFLTHLAVQRDVAASTQNQALSAILFLYRDVLELDLGWIEGFERPKRPARLPEIGWNQVQPVGDDGIDAPIEQHACDLGIVDGVAEQPVAGVAHRARLLR